MTLEIDTKEKGMGTESHNLHRHKQKTKKKTHPHKPRRSCCCVEEQAQKGCSPVQNAPPHGQEGVVHGQSVTRAVGGLDEE